jgi:hypothetical protein
MYDEPWNEEPYRRFRDFIAPGAGRYGMLASFLDEGRFDYRLVELAGNRHFFIFPPGEDPFQGGNPPVPKVPPKTVLAAHYDRVKGSPGANDNSAAVFELLETAGRLKEKNAGNWLIIFTDKEELQRGEGIKSQGSFTLGTLLRDLGLGKIQIFIFDACGAGDNLIISTMADHLLAGDQGPAIAQARNLARLMRTRALETARNLSMDKVLLIPTPFSDDAGFLRAGIVAQTITMLPSAEAARFASLIRHKPDFPSVLISRDSQRPRDRALIPETWRSLNGPGDSPLRLTPEHFRRVVRFAVGLCD